MRYFQVVPKVSLTQILMAIGKCVALAFALTVNDALFFISTKRRTLSIVADTSIMKKNLYYDGGDVMGDVIGGRTMECGA